MLTSSSFSCSPAASCSPLDSVFVEIVKGSSFESSNFFSFFSEPDFSFSVVFPSFSELAFILSEKNLWLNKRRYNKERRKKNYT